MELGWIKLHREIKNKVIWNSATPEQFKIFIALLLMVNHYPNDWEYQGKKFRCEPGQMITSLPSIMKTCGPGITIQKVRTALKKFKEWGILTDESTRQGRLITLVNWALYQANEKKLTDELTDEQQTTNRRLTDEQQLSKNVIMENEKTKEFEESTPAPKNSFSEKPDKGKNPEVTECLSFYKKLFNEYTEEEPHINFGKDGKLLKSIIQARGLEQTKELLERYFARADTFTINKGYPIGLFSSQLNSLLVKDAGSVPKAWGDLKQWYMEAEAKERQRGENKPPYLLMICRDCGERYDHSKGKCACKILR